MSTEQTLPWLPPGVEALTPSECAAILKPYQGVNEDDLAWDELVRAAHAAGARAGFLAGLEAGAKVCEAEMTESGPRYVESEAAANTALRAAANAIRQMKEEQ